MARFRALASYGAVMLAAMSGGAHAAVTISTGPTQNMSCSGGVCAPTATSANLNTGDLEAYLASGTLTVTTTGSGSAQATDIVVTSSFDWASASSLTLDANRSVTVEQPVSVNGPGGMTLLTNDGGSNGTLSFISGGSLSFLGTANSLTINGKAYTLANSIAALAADIANKSSGTYALSANYDASHDGTYKTSPITKTFKGAFNGLGNAISNLTIKASAKRMKGTGNIDVGLFAYIDTKGIVGSLRLLNANVTIDDTKEKTGSVNGVIAGLNSGTVFNSLASGRIQVTGDGAGGLVGGNRGTIIASTASTTVLATGDSSTSGIAVGGLAAGSFGTIEGSFATGSATVSGATVAAYSGGLVGFNEGLIDNCYAEGAAPATTISYAGGLVGFTTAATTQSYSTGAVTAGSGSFIGGLLGYDQAEANTNDYWDTTTSGITNLSQGAGNIPNDPGIAGDTTAQLQAALPAGFDPTIWAENPSINGGLPYLINNPPQ